MPASAPRTRDLAGPQIELDASEQGRMRVGVEVGIGQVRYLARMAVEFDQVGALDLTEVGPRSPRRRGAAGRGPPGPCGGRRVRIGQELADSRAAAGVVDRFGVAGPESRSFTRRQPLA